MNYLKHLDIRPFLAIFLIDIAIVEYAIKAIGILAATGYNLYKFYLLYRDNKNNQLNQKKEKENDNIHL